VHEVYCEFKYSGAAFALLAVAVGSTLALVIFVPFPDAVRALAFAWLVAMAWRAHEVLTGVRALRLDCNRTVAVRDRIGWRTGELRGRNASSLRGRPSRFHCPRDCAAAMLFLNPGR
jgi:hypothetical protein